MNRFVSMLLSIVTFILTPVAAAIAGNHEGLTKEDMAKAAKVQYSPYAGRSYPTRVLWGDTHLHTAVSVDAGTLCRLGQEEAYRFAELVMPLLPLAHPARGTLTVNTGPFGETIANDIRPIAQAAS